MSDEKKIQQLMNDLQNLEVLPCGCWVNTRTGQTVYFCYHHLMELPMERLDDETKN